MTIKIKTYEALSEKEVEFFALLEQFDIEVDALFVESDPTDTAYLVKMINEDPPRTYLFSGSLNTARKEVLKLLQ